MSFWSWWIVAALLAVVEIVAPGAFFIWLAGAAAVTGLVVGVLPFLSWEIQALVFAFMSLAAVIIWWKRPKGSSEETDTLNRRGAQLVGRTGVLAQAIVGGRGRVRIDDSLWIATGPELAAETAVTVIGVDGAVLEVMRKTD